MTHPSATDVRAIIERQNRTRKGRQRLHNAFAAFCALLFVVAEGINMARGRPFGHALRLLFPLLFVNGGFAWYTSRHIQALRDTIADPDPALDAHFAECLDTEREETAALGRRAFVERFADRLPQLDAAGWSHVAHALPSASTEQAERMLHLLADGAPGAAIAPLEAFADGTKVARLQTAARQTLGDLRLRVARERVQGALGQAEERTETERVRLGLAG